MMPQIPRRCHPIMIPFLRIELASVESEKYFVLRPSLPQLSVMSYGTVETDVTGKDASQSPMTTTQRNSST